MVDSLGQDHHHQLRHRCGLCKELLPEKDLIWIGNAGRYGRWQCIYPSVCRWRRKRKFVQRQTSFGF